jgi:hypothetical protein
MIEREQDLPRKISTPMSAPRDMGFCKLFD